MRRYIWEGAEDEKHVRSVSLAHCSVSCRGHANRAMVTCHDWIDNRASAGKRRECAEHLVDMGQFCLVTLKVGWCRLSLSKPVLKASLFERLKLKYYEVLSRFAFKFNLRCYIKGPASQCTLYIKVGR